MPSHNCAFRSWTLNLVVLLVATIALTLPAFSHAASANEASAGTSVSARITQAIDETKLVTLFRHTRPDVIRHAKEYDRGRVSDAWYADHILLALQRSPEIEQQLDQFIDSLNDRKSPNFHKWLDAEQFGERYGVAQQDVDKVVGWLQSHGFQVNQVYASRMMIDLSGTAGSVRDAFHTEIHQLDVDGQMHFANMSDPQIPAALAPVIKGIVSLNDFRADPMYQSARDYTFAGCASSVDNPQSPGTCYSVTAQDNAVIYNLNPLWSAGISGQGQTIALTEDNNVYTTGTAETTDSDLTTYRSTFGLSGYSGFSFSTVHPGGCTDPGTGADDGEAAIDVEMATAVAPSAKIELISCATSGVTEGTIIAEANLINGSAPYPGVISQSYGICENYTGAAGEAFFYNTFQQAAAQGISVFVSSGDYLSGGCANIHSSEYNEYGLGITGWGQTPYNVSVGGTDFEDTFNSKEANLAEGGSVIPLSTYWNQTSPTAAPYSSALSYIPEIPWDNSCASPLLSIVATGSPVGYGTSGTCNTSPFSTTASYLDQSAVGGAGGASSCATGYFGTGESTDYSSQPGCQGYPKPSFQTGAALSGGQAVYGMNTDGVRDIPDVAMFASNGPWGHYETVCWSDPSQTSGGATSCSGAPSTWAGFGGTSVASPTMAGIQALINQQTGENWGNPLSIYYQIGQNEYGTAGGTFQGSACNSSGSGGPASGCAFNDVTQGDNDEACRDDGSTVKYHCYLPSSTNGVGSTDVISGASVINGGNGYTSTPTCTVAGPTNSNPEYSPTTGATLWAGGTQATCTATVSSSTTTAKWTVAFEQSTNYYTGYKVTVGGTTYNFVTSLTGAPANSVLIGSSTTNDAKNFEAAINLTSSQCGSAAPCYNVTAANASATATESTLTVTLTAITAGYAGNFSVSSVSLGEIESEILIEITQTTAGQGPNYVSGVTISNGGSGYGPETPVTFGGPGSGAIAVANTTIGTASSSYQPAYPAASGYDMATGLGSPNAAYLLGQCNWSGSATPAVYVPTPNSTLTGSSATFGWCIQPGATAYWLDVGSSSGGNNYFQSGSLSPATFSQTVSGLPTNGSTIYVTWWYYVNGAWSNTEYQYSAYGAGGEIATMSSPTPNSTLSGGSQTFTWNAGTQSTAYEIDAGSASGGNQYFQSGNLGTATSENVTNLPTNGSTVYITLWSLLNGNWVYNEYQYTAFSSMGGSIATLTYPTPPGTTLTGSSVTFTWQAGTDTASAYWIDVGNTAGGSQYYQSGSLPTSTTAETVTTLPTDGSEVYVTLYTMVGGTWYNNPYTFFAANGNGACLGTITSPAPNSVLPSTGNGPGGTGGPTQPFTWTPSSAPGCSSVVTGYWLDAGEQTQENAYYQSGQLSASTTTNTAMNLPTALANPSLPATVQITLYTLVNGTWQSNVYDYTEAAQ